MSKEKSDKKHIEILDGAPERVIISDHKKKLVVAGAGAGKTTSFAKILDAAGYSRDNCLVLTFLTALKSDMEGNTAHLS